MTKFILAGGCDRKYPSYWDNLSKVVCSEFSKPVILSCMFAQEIDNRSDQHNHFDKLFRQFFNNTKVIHATEDSFYDQLSEADVVYLHGGRTQLLMQSIPDVDRFVSAVENKIVIGSSAGANFLSTVCFSPSARKVIKASSILNLGIVVHYGIDQFKNISYSREFWDEAADKVRTNLSSGTPILLLPEGTFAVFKK